MVDELAKDYYNKMYSMPPNEVDMADFARQVLKQFIEELEQNQTAVAWNYGCDSVVFIRKDLGDLQSLKTIKEKYLVNSNNKSNTNDAMGRRAQRDTERDQKTDILHECTEVSKHEHNERKENDETIGSQKDIGN